MDTKKEHYLSVLLALEAGEISIGQARMLMGLWDGEEVAHVDVHQMRDTVIARMKGVWDAEFRDRHAVAIEEPARELPARPSL